MARTRTRCLLGSFRKKALGALNMLRSEVIHCKPTQPHKREEHRQRHRPMGREREETTCALGKKKKAASVRKELGGLGFRAKPEGAARLG